MYMVKAVLANRTSSLSVFTELNYPNSIYSYGKYLKGNMWKGDGYAKETWEPSVSCSKRTNEIFFTGERLASSLRSDWCLPAIVTLREMDF